MSLNGRVARAVGFTVALAAIAFLLSSAERANEALAATAAPPEVSGDTTTKPRLASLSASAFADAFVHATAQYARANGDTARISDADCVQAARGRYMCSYAVRRPGAPRTCHIMQARLTPEAASSFAITLAGRTGRCGSLREALASLP